MANTIQIKRSSTASDTPSASDLAVGELAVNTADAKLFTKHTDGTVKELAGGGGSGISAVVDDTSPQLGGNLDTNDKNIQFGDSSGATVNRLQLGASQDLQIYHDGSGSIIDDTSGTGILKLISNQVKIESTTGEDVARFIEDSDVILYQNNTERFRTTSYGTQTTGTSYVTGSIAFEGSTADANETTVNVADPTADRTITLLDASGYVPLFTTSPASAITDGTSGQVLSTDGSGALSFTSPTERLISSGTVSSVSSIDFDNTVITGFEQYRIVLYELRSSNDNVQLRMRLGTGNTAITSTLYMQSEYQYGIGTSSSQRSSTYNSGVSNHFRLAVDGNSLGTGTGENFYGEILLPNPNQTNGYKHAVCRQSNLNYISYIQGQRISAMALRTTSALNFVTIFCESGNIAQANYRLYGIL